MSKASEEDLATLHGEVARALTGVISEGVPVVVRGEEKDSVVKVPAPAAYFAAAITLLKNNAITADVSKNEELSDLSKALADRRKKAKGKLTQQIIEDAAAQLERDLPGFMQ